MANFIRHNKSNPCPICDSSHKNDCRTNKSTGIVYCRAGLEYCPPIGWTFLDFDAHGFAKFCETHRHAKLTGNGKRSKVPPPKDHAFRERLPVGPAPRDPFTDQKASSRLFRQIMERPHQLEGKLLHEFTMSMDLPMEAGYGRDLRAVYMSGNPSMGYLMRDGAGSVVGMKLRDLDGEKRTLGFVGLLYDEAKLIASNSNGPIYVVEGGSDWLALTYLGFQCIARDNNTGGAGDIIELVKRLGIDPARLVVMGENDGPKKNKAGVDIWPGRDGAHFVAQAVANGLDARIRIGMPPTGTKDVRDWYFRQWVSRQPDEQHDFSCTDFFVFDDAERAELKQLWLDLTIPLTTTINPAAPSPDDRLPDGQPVEDVFPAGGIYAAELSAVLGNDGASLADEVYAPPKPLPACCQACPNWKKSLMQHRGKGFVGNFKFSCRRLDCPVCGERARRRWIDSVRIRMYQHGRRTNDAPVYVYFVDYRTWKRVYKHIQRHGGNAIRINAGNPDMMMILSSVDPGSRVSSVEAMSPTAAADRGASTIAAILKLSKKVYFGVGTWKQVWPPKALPQGWVNVGYNNASEEVEDAVFGQYGSKLWRTRHGRIGKITPGMDLEWMLWELQEGGPQPRLDMSNGWGGKKKAEQAAKPETAKASEAATEATTEATTEPEIVFTVST